MNETKQTVLADQSKDQQKTQAELSERDLEQVVAAGCCHRVCGCHGCHEVCGGGYGGGGYGGGGGY